MMKICFKQIAICCTLILSLCISPCAIAGKPATEEQANIKPERPELRITPVVARQGINTFGDELVLPDGSVIKTVWPTALCVVDVPDRPWANEPCVPLCEPAIYSLTRILPSGKQLWAKSYVGRFEQFYEPCDSYRFGFTLKTRIFDFGGKLNGALLYFEPYQGTFFIGNPNLTKAYLHLNADTGDAVEDIPANIRIVDAEWLRKFKQNVWKEALIKFPELPFSKSHHPDTDELIKKRQAQTALIRKNRYGLLFSRVEKAI